MSRQLRNSGWTYRSSAIRVNANFGGFSRDRIDESTIQEDIPSRDAPPPSANPEFVTCTTLHIPCPPSFGDGWLYRWLDGRLDGWQYAERTHSCAMHPATSKAAMTFVTTKSLEP